MKTLGLITEYNPFHFGHKYHLEKSMEITESTHSLAIMSSSFLQRGEPSLVDKWTKAKMAIENGVDLVIELPFIYSSQSAELFAYGGISILNKINIVDCLAFGTELGELEPLSKLAKILVEEPSSYKNQLKQYLFQGFSYSVSRSKALVDYLSEQEYSDNYSYSKILKGSNNILAIEYLKALYRLNSSIEPIAIKRMGSDYKDLEANNGFASATGIRNIIFENGLSSISKLVPNDSFNILNEYEEKYNSFNHLENYSHIFNYLLRITDKKHLLDILDMENGLENRILQKGSFSLSIGGIIDSITTKRYPKTRIQRIFIHLLNHLDGSTIKDLYSHDPQYIRVLGSNNKGFEILNKIKLNSDIQIITKYADYKSINNRVINDFLSYEERATDLFYLYLTGNTPITKMDYTTTPYFK